MVLSFLSIVLAVFFVSEILFIPSLLSLDFFVHQWIQEQRSCGLDAFAIMLQDWTRSGFLAPVMIALVAVVPLYKRRWHELLHFLLVVGVGALICELTKFVVIRPRPSVLPFVLEGNSFPSGHVANSVILLGGVYSVLRSQCQARKWLALSAWLFFGAVVLIIAWQRLYLGRHWFTDVFAGLLLASGWLCFVTARWRQKVPAAAWVGRGLILAAVFFLLWLIPAVRVPLPSPFTVRSQPIARVDFASPSSKDLGNDQWSAPWEELGKPIRTMNQRESSAYLRLPNKTVYMLALGIRPLVESRKGTCYRMAIFLNNRPLKEMILHTGWRDYDILAPQEKVTAGLNEVSFRLSSKQSLPGVFMYLEAFPLESFFPNWRGRTQVASSLEQ